jgi:teichuronic acid biosynthesis glycosyltransferase TuaC
MTASPLRVLAVTNMLPTPEDPGYGAFVAGQMEWVARCGVEVAVEFIDGRRTKAEYLRAIGRVRGRVMRDRFHLVHAHYGLVGFVAGFQRLPLVVSFCGDDLLGTPDGAGGITAASRIQRALSRYAARRAAGIVCKSEQLRAALPVAADRARAHVLPNGVDVSRFSPGSQDAARSRLGLDLSERLVMFPHTPGVPRKRLDLAHAAMRDLVARTGAGRLWIVQGVPHASMPDCYRAADCLLLTSDQEGSPNVVKEALCCDLPVVSVDAGDVPQWIALTPGSVLVERTPESIASGLARVLASGARTDGARVRDALSAERIAQRLIEIYRLSINGERT